MIHHQEEQMKDQKMCIDQVVRGLGQGISLLGSNPIENKFVSQLCY